MMSRLVFVLVTLALGACASLPPANVLAPPSDPVALRDALQRVERYELSGRLAMAIADEGYTANVHWRQRGLATDLALDGPLGLGGLNIVFGPEQFTLRGADGARFDDAAARAEIERRLGVALPLASLRYWLLGVPDPAGSSVDLPPEPGSATRGFEQQGWQVRFREYVPWARSSWSLPRRLEISSGAGRARARLVVERWQEFRP